MSARLQALADAEDIVTAAYYEPCGEPGRWMSCPKCQTLLRVQARINEWQDEEAEVSVARDVVPLQEHERVNR